MVFHGTITRPSNVFETLGNYYSSVQQSCLIINKIYESHGVYKAFENGIGDYNTKSFWTSTSPSSACFYALQSPEFFARFASRSDYYKWDTYLYDRNAYYRKEYDACVNNLKIEMNEFNFTESEKETVLKHFKIMWDELIKPDTQNVIFFKELDASETLGRECDSVYETIKSYFVKVHNRFDFEEFKNNLQMIILPDIKKFMKREYPTENRKYLLIDNKVYYPDFYIDAKYSTNLYYTFDKTLSDKMVYIDELIDKNDREKLIILFNEAKPNSIKAREFLNSDEGITIDEIEEYYSDKLKNLIFDESKQTEISLKAKIIEQIAEDVGLKYVLAKTYKKYFKNISQYYIYEFRKYLGIKLFEHYDGILVITEEKIKKLINIYKLMLEDYDYEFFKELPLKVFNLKVELIQ